VYDGVNPVKEATGATTIHLLTGLGVDEYLTRTIGGTTEYLLGDALGSTLALADGSGSVATQYSYEPFGTSSVSGTSSSSEFGYTGREDDGTGVYYYRARYYHPVLQRFLSEDPIEFAGGDLNLYAYVWNSPTMFVDPRGLWGIGVVGGGTAEVGSGPRGGAAYQANSGVGLFGGGPSGLNVGGYTSSGGFAGAANIKQWVMGAAAGLGSGIFFSPDATQAKGLLGPFDTWSLNLPIVGLQLATDGTTRVFSLSLGKSWGFGFSRYTVTTTNAATFIGRK
jgi:RHS repeat-associated protein